jgi:flagellar basal body-associated protein FliL
LGTVDNIPESRSNFIFIIIFVVIGVCAVVMSAMVIWVIIIKMRKKVNNRTQEFEMNNKLLRAASLKLSENSLPSSGLMKMLSVYKFLLIFFFYVDMQ